MKNVLILLLMFLSIVSFINASKADPCLSSPCGLNAECWRNGDRFMCTCSRHNLGFGNPYVSCHECVYDHQCPNKNDYICKNNVCISLKSNENREMFEQNYDIEVGKHRFYLSKEKLSWPQAQYECASHQGLLAEPKSTATFRLLVRTLKNKLKNEGDKGRNVTNVWIGATDFEQRGKFVWYHFQKRLRNALKQGSTTTKNDSKNDSKDDRCVHLDLVSGRWLSHSCENAQFFVCQLNLNNNSSSFGKNNRLPRVVQSQVSAESVCGRRFVRQGRIVGGGLATYGEWPWQVSLQQLNSDNVFGHKCGAALINHRHVVSAAHCVHAVPTAQLQVVLGEYNTLDTREPHDHVTRRVARVLEHSRFDSKSYEYDIAILRLDRGVQFRANIIPICLPKLEGREGIEALEGAEATITGWGRRSVGGSISPVLREVHLPIISNEKCMELYRKSGRPEWIPNLFLCAGGANGGEDSCEGDSGGPLVVRDDAGRFRLAGIISWGIGCGQRNRPGVYTRISHFKAWILKNIR